MGKLDGKIANVTGATSGIGCGLRVVSRTQPEVPQQAFARPWLREPIQQD